MLERNHGTKSTATYRNLREKKNKNKRRRKDDPQNKRWGLKQAKQRRREDHNKMRRIIYYSYLLTMLQLSWAIVCAIAFSIQSQKIRAQIRVVVRSIKVLGLYYSKHVILKDHFLSLLRFLSFHDMDNPFSVEGGRDKQNQPLLSGIMKISVIRESGIAP